MDRGGARVSGRTLGRGQGFAYLNRAGIGYRVGRGALTLLAIGGFVAGVSATSAALEGYANAGVVTENAGGVVLSVSPTGFAWREGVRPGQLVVSLDDAQSSGGWRIETVDDNGPHVSSAAPVDGALRESLPLAGLGMAVGGLAMVFLRTHRRWVAPAACVALWAASLPLFLHGNPQLSTAAMAASAAAPGLWLAANAPVPRIARVAVAVLAAATILWWALARLSGLEAFEQLEDLRKNLAGYGTVAVVGGTTVVPYLRGQHVTIVRPRLFDVIAIAVVAGLALALMTVLAVSPVIIGVLLVAAALVFPRVRRFGVHRLEHALLADVREQATIDAAEAERSRMARELHDAPLQQLAGVIRRLELLPEAKAESDELRAVARELRAVATDLRPPVLDDLGLAAALEFLSEETSTNGTEVSSAISDSCGLDAARRPPAAVELAAFRISQEAVANALRHADATRIKIAARIAPDLVDLEITDDGVGMTAEARRTAARRGRLGLSSMRRRAESIDAELTVSPGRPGTVVAMRWRR